MASEPTPNDREGTMDWTPPERVWIEQAADGLVALDRPDRSDQPAYVPEARLEEAQAAFSRAVDAAVAKVHERSAERDALRSRVEELESDLREKVWELRDRVEELEAGLREIREPVEDTYNDSGNWSDLKAVLRRVDALLSGGSSEEPRPKHDADCIRRGDDQSTSLCTCGLTDEQVRPDTGETCPECKDRHGLDFAPPHSEYGRPCPCCRRDTTSEEDR